MPSARLGPWTGVDARTTDPRSVQGNPICGGYNYEVKGGELWPRPGYANAIALTSPDTGPPYAATPQKILSFFRNGTGFTYIIYPLVVFRFRTPSGNLTVPYDPTVTENITFTHGSAAVVSTTAFTVGQIVQNPVNTNIYYQIVAVSGGVNGTLDRLHFSTGGTYSTSRYAPLGGATDTVDACVFQQGVSHAAGAVWGTSSQVIAGREYMVLTFSASKPKAIDLTSSNPVLEDFWRDTSVSPAVLLTQWPSTCCVHKSNLILGGAGDADDDYHPFCIWYTQPRDMLQWHTGISGIDGTPNSIRFVEGRDEIRAVRTIGDRLVVHRQLSQEVGEYTGSIDFPYRFTRNLQELGINSVRQIAEIEKRHFIYTHRGPAMYDGNDVRLFGDEVLDLFERDADGGNTGIPDIHVYALQSTGKVLYVGFQNMLDPDSERLGYAEAWKGRALAYDVRTGQWAFLSFPDRPSAMASLLTRTNENTDDTYARDLWGGNAGDIYETSTNAYWYGFDRWKEEVARPVYSIEAGVTNNAQERVTCVPAGFRTRWYDFDTANQKLLTNIEIELRDAFVRQSRRRLYLAGVGGDVTDFTFVLNVRIYTDYDLDTPKEDFDIAIPASDFGAITDSGVGWGAEKLLKVEWPARSLGDVFAFEFSNAMELTSIQAGYKEGLWRVVDVLVTYTDTQSMRRVDSGPGMG